MRYNYLTRLAGGTLDNGTLFLASMNGKLSLLILYQHSDWQSPQLTTTSSGGLGCAPSSSPIRLHYPSYRISQIKVLGAYSDRLYRWWKNGIIYAYTLKDGVWSTAPEYVYPRQELEPVTSWAISLLRTTYLFAHQTGRLRLTATTLHWNGRKDLY